MVILSDWKEAHFDEVFLRVNISNRKLQTSKFSDMGKLPVIDQGQTRIAGFTDCLDLELNPPQDGLVIFGDHTRVVKHVRHPFVVGADGVQVLRSRDGFNAEFLALLLSVSKIPNTGYNRHFKFLKDLTFTCPTNLIEQEAIAEALSDADAAIESLDALIVKKRDIRDAMLFDLVVSSEHKNSVSFKSDVSLKARIGWQGLTTGEYEVSSDCYLVTGTDLNGGAVNWASCWQVAQKRYDQDPNIQLKNNDVLVTKDGTIGKVGFVADLSAKATLNSGVFVIRPTTNHLVPEYLRYVMFSSLFRRFLDRLAAGSTISHLYQKDFVNFAFAVPAVDEQVVVSKMLDDVDSEIRRLIEQSTKLKMVKEGMMQDLLTGKVRLV